MTHKPDSGGFTNRKSGHGSDLNLVFVRILLNRLTAEQIASALEEFELVCEQRGLPVAAASCEVDNP